MTIREQSPIVELQRWFDSPIGRYVHRWEQRRIDDLLVDVFGYRAIQYGLADFNFLAANRMPFKAYAGPRPLSTSQRLGWQASLVCKAEALPFDSDSLDLLVLPHTLETSVDQHQVLREAQRVLVPEGRLVIAGFNPWSLWGLRARFPWITPWFPEGGEGELSPSRLKDWLRLLSFDIDRGHFGCYAPPCRTDQWLERFSFMEPAGDRWWPIFGATYVVSAVKRVAGMRLITPVWKRKSRRRSARATAGAAAQRGQY